MADRPEENKAFVKPVFVYNRVCIKSDCIYKRKTHEQKIKIKAMSTEQLRDKEKQILVPSFMFDQFETNEYGQQIIPVHLGDKLALCYVHLTSETRKFYNEFKVLPPWARVVQKDPQKVFVQKKVNGDYKYTGIKVKHEALKSPLFLSAHQNDLADSQAGTSSENIELQPRARSESSNDEPDTTRPSVIPQTPAVQNLLVKKSGTKLVELHLRIGPKVLKMGIMRNLPC